MAYKIVCNTAGDVVAFGPNDNNYEPVVKEGEELTIEDTIPSPSQKDLDAVEAAVAVEASAVEKLVELGLTADEVAVVIPT